MILVKSLTEKNFLSIWISVICLFTSASLVYAVEVSAPSEIILHSKAGVPNCTSFDVSVQDSDALIFQTAWSAIPDRNLQHYTFSARDFGLIVEHPSIIWVISGSSSVYLCALSNEQGIYSGVVLMRPAQSMGGIGTWIILNVSESDSRDNRLLERVRIENLSSILHTENSILLNLEMMFVLLCGFIIIVLYRAKNFISLSN